jgi:hypothetical protein
LWRKTPLSDDVALLTNLHRYLLQDGEDLPRFLHDVRMGDSTVTFKDGGWEFRFPQEGIPFPALGGRNEFEILEREILALLQEIGHRHGVEIYAIDALCKPNTEGMAPELADTIALAVEAAWMPRIKRSRTPKAFEALFRGLRIGWLLCRIGIRPCEKMFNSNLNLRKGGKKYALAKSEASKNTQAAREYLQRAEGYPGRKRALLEELEAKYEGSNFEAIKTAVRRLKKKLKQKG